jgi:hypothetical protein
MARVSCYFPLDITQTTDFSARFPHGIGVVSTLEARSALTLDEVTAFQRRVQNDAAEWSGGRGQPERTAVDGGVVLGVVGPAAPDDADPGARQDAQGVGVVGAAGSGPVVDGFRSGTALAAAVGEVDERLA